MLLNQSSLLLNMCCWVLKTGQGDRAPAVLRTRLFGQNEIRIGLQPAVRVPAYPALEPGMEGSMDDGANTAPHKGNAVGVVCSSVLTQTATEVHGHLAS